MGPGLPVFAIGRNPHIAWGGTNLRAASSDLYDVGAVPGSEIAERRERIRVRWWFDGEATVRETRWGPIVTDVPHLARLDLPPLALKWAGHGASDEIGAMLAVSRARGFDEFRAAFERFAVPGQNMLYADADGNIGQVMAAWLPARRGSPADVFLDTDAHDASWGTMLSGADLPHSFNPEAGFLASANNRPPETKMPVGFFFSPDDRVFSPDDRVRRMAELIGSEGAVSVETLKALQRDVHMSSSAKLRDLFVSLLDRLGTSAAADAKGAEAIGRLRDWDGAYRRESSGAIAFERFRADFAARFLRPSRRRRPCRVPRGDAPGRGAAGRGTSPPRTRRSCARRSPPGCARPPDGLDAFADWGWTCTVSGSRIRCPGFRSSAAGTGSPTRAWAEARRR